MSGRSIAVLLGLAVAAAAAVFLAAGHASPAAGGVRKLGENHWAVPKAERDAYLSDPARMNEQFLLKPEPGGAPGSVERLTVFRVAPGSPMHAVGFLKGDRILTVNGAPVVTQERVINLLHEVRTGASLRVEAGRGPSVLRYRVDFE